MHVYSIDCFCEYYYFMYVRADNMCRYSVGRTRGVVCMYSIWWY